MSIDPAKRVHVIGWSCLMILALGLTIPAVVGPFQMGDDFVFHVGNWIDVLNHWKQGVAFPSWNGMQAFGLGEPTHLFYPPLSFYLGAFLTWLSGPAYAPVIFLGLCIVIAGMTMYSFASEYLSPEQGWLAAILFALNPYLLLDIIVRSAFAETLAMALLPLVFRPLLKLRTVRDGVVLGLMFSLQILCNFPAAVITAYSIAFIILIRAYHERNYRLLLFGLLSGLLGAAIGAVAILPVLLDQKNVQIAIVLLWNWSRFFLPSRDLLFSTPMLVLALTAVLTQLFGKIYSAHSRLTALFVFSNLALLFVTQLSSPFYSSLPFLANLQFPWRWLMALSFAAAFMLAASQQVRFLFRKMGFAAIMLTATALLLASAAAISWSPQKARSWRRVPWGSPQSLAMLREPVPEYVPTGAPVLGLNIVASDLSSKIRNTPGVTVEKWEIEHKKLATIVASDISLQLPVLAYPGWFASIDGMPVATTRDSSTGAIRLDVPAGSHSVELRFRAGRSRFYGFLISLLSLCCALFYLSISFARRRRSAAVSASVSPTLAVHQY